MKYQTRSGEVRRSTGQQDQEAAFGELMKQAGRRASGEMDTASPERVRVGTLLDLLVALRRPRNRL